MELVHAVHETGSSSRSDTVSGLWTNGGGYERRDVFHVSFDPETEPIIGVVTDAVAVVHNKEPNELSPLQQAVDPDALSTLISPGGDDRPGAEEIRFVYEGMEVTIASTGDLWLRWE